MPSHRTLGVLLIISACPGGESPTIAVEAGRYWAHATEPGTATAAVTAWFEYKPTTITWGFVPKTAERSVAAGAALGDAWISGLEAGTAYDIRACTRDAHGTTACDGTSTAFTTAASTTLAWVSIDPADSRHLVAGGQRWVPWGNNYVKVSGLALTDPQLVEDAMYDAAGLALIDADLARLANTAPPDGAENAIRMHVQLHTFLTDPTTPDAEALARFAHVIELAEDHGLHVMVTGLNEFYPPENPTWVGEQTDEATHWATQAIWWTNMALALRNSPGVFAYDLMNEPYVGGSKIDAAGLVEWTNVPPTSYCTYGENAALGIHGTCFGQFVSPDQGTRDAGDVAAAWTSHMVHAIRYADPFENDSRHLITIGAAGAFGLSNPFNGSAAVQAQLDFLSPHLYPNNANALDLAQSLAAMTTKPIIAGETFTFGNVRHLISTSCNSSWVQGWFGQYDGRILGDPCGAEGNGCLLFDAWYQVQAAYGPTMVSGGCPPTE